MTDSDEPRKTDQDKGKRMSSENLALLIIDALIDAGLVKKEDLERAVAVAKEEIDVRKALGDSPV
jgi:hypothetical protein